MPYLIGLGSLNTEISQPNSNLIAPSCLSTTTTTVLSLGSSPTVVPPMASTSREAMVPKNPMAFHSRNPMLESSKNQNLSAPHQTKNITNLNTPSTASNPKTNLNMALPPNTVSNANKYASINTNIALAADCLLIQP